VSRRRCKPCVLQRWPVAKAFKSLSVCWGAGAEDADKKARSLENQPGDAGGMNGVSARAINKTLALRDSGRSRAAHRARRLPHLRSSAAIDVQGAPRASRRNANA